MSRLDNLWPNTKGPFGVRGLLANQGLALAPVHSTQGVTMEVLPFNIYGKSLESAAVTYYCLDWQDKQHILGKRGST